jgi:hypothetical protein
MIFAQKDFEIEEVLSKPLIASFRSMEPPP